jgi:hypothetical protein
MCSHQAVPQGRPENRQGLQPLLARHYEQSPEGTTERPQIFLNCSKTNISNSCPPRFARRCGRVEFLSRRSSMKPDRVSNFEFRFSNFHAGPRAFVLLEILIGVMIFVLGVLALGRCVGNCVAAEGARQETERARLALENRMAEIEAGEIATDTDRTDDLDDSFPGMTMKQSRVVVTARNEKNQDILGLYQVNLEVDWTSQNEPESSALSFYVLRSK